MNEACQAAMHLAGRHAGGSGKVGQRYRAWEERKRAQDHKCGIERLDAPPGIGSQASILVLLVLHRPYAHA
jgi:hypothetical protein